MTTHPRPEPPVPIAPSHRRSWRALWRRCSCGLTEPCIDRITSPLPPSEPAAQRSAAAPSEPVAARTSSASGSAAARSAATLQPHAGPSARHRAGRPGEPDAPPVPLLRPPAAAPVRQDTLLQPGPRHRRSSDAQRGRAGGLTPGQAMRTRASMPSPAARRYVTPSIAGWPDAPGLAAAPASSPFARKRQRVMPGVRA